MELALDKIYQYETMAEIICKEIVTGSYKIAGITGTSCVGKSTFAQMIKTQLEKEKLDVQVIRMDDYLKEKYRGKTQFWNRQESTYLKAEFFDWRGMKEDVNSLLAGKSITRTCYTRGIGWEHKKTAVPAKLIFVEGLFLDSVQAAEFMEYDLLISLVAEDGLIRKLRLERDAYYRQNYKNFRRTERDTLKEIEDTLLAGKSYEISCDDRRYLKLNVLEDYKMIVMECER